MTIEASIAIVVAFIALLGTTLAPIINSVTQLRQEQRKRRHDYILSVVTALIDIRSALQYEQLPQWQIYNDPEKFPEIAITPEFKNSQFSFGKAYAIMISVDIEEIRKKAEIVMLDPDPDKKLKAIDFALKRLGEEYKLL